MICEKFHLEFNPGPPLKGVWSPVISKRRMQGSEGGRTEGEAEKGKEGRGE